MSRPLNTGVRGTDFPCKSNIYIQGKWFALSKEHATLDLWVVSRGPTLGVEITKTNLKKKKKFSIELLTPPELNSS